MNSHHEPLGNTTTPGMYIQKMNLWSALLSRAPAADPIGLGHQNTPVLDEKGR